ncbi:carbohydrate-binding protein [Chitinophaga tropicalis]|uniref:Carbohydrate-binding protein n=1 Tax=Chitinophaga tropicalis TaxID=2683588 RepID=A0A7K1U4E8_9BACT|nr:carbohydrate-binding protein [Chitinophaga tropicalis]MVT09220.1 carbohydrate-binding protein [Chitinophaga tropicalis]
MRRILKFHVALLAAGLILCSAVGSYAQLPPGFTQKRLTGDDINEATAMVHAPDGRIFIAERSGNVKVYQNGTVSTVHSVVTTTASEQGLLGITLHPQFASNGKCYIFYTDPQMTVHYLDVIVINAASQVTSSQRVMQFDPIINGFHNGGALLFKDGLLYVAIGESNSSSESPKSDTYRGKILRLTEDGQPAPGNPYYSEAGASRQKRSIWAMGMRNPWKMSLDPVSQKIFVIDVGGNYEEINDVTNPDPAKNYNYGWDQNGRSGPEQPATTIQAAFYYPHTNWGCAITSGMFFNPAVTSYPAEYKNRFFFSDWCAQWYRSVDISNLTPSSSYTEFSGSAFGNVLGTSVGIDGNIYYIKYFTRGSLWRIEYSNNEAPSIVNQPVSTTVVAGDPVTFSVSASGATPFTFRWQKDGVDIAGATSNTYSIAQAIPADSGIYRCIVTNAIGSVTSAGATLTVQPFNARPVPHILTPSGSLTWNVLDTIHYSGEATDAEDGVLPASAYHWEVRFFHKDNPTSEHWHPGPVVPAGTKTGSFIADNGGESSPNIWFRILLTVTDSKGRTGVDSVDVQPNKVVLTAAANVPGLKLVLGTEAVSPFSKTMVVNSLTTLQAITPQLLRDTSFGFVSWAHGGNALQQFRVPATNTTYTATYKVDTSLQQPFTGVPITLPGKVEIEDFDKGGEGIAYHDTGAGNSGNQYRVNENVDLEGCSEGGFNIGYVAAGEWLEYTVNVTTPGVYTVGVRVATPYADKKFHIELDGQDISGTLNVPLTGGFQAWQTISFTTPVLTAGVKVLRVSLDATDFNINYLTFSNGTEGPVGKTIPGLIQAEDYDDMNGIGKEGTADTGGGENIGWVQAGDWLDYHVNVSAAGTYTVSFRVASAPGGGPLELRSGNNILASVPVNATGGWQSWTTLTTDADLPAGPQVLRIYAAGADFNLNWFDVRTAGAASKLMQNTNAAVIIYPNPVTDVLTIKNAKNDGVYRITNISNARTITRKSVNGVINVSNLTPGIYIIEFYNKGKIEQRKFIKM